MKKYLSDSPIWIEPSNLIKELDHKAILIHMPEGYIIDGHISIKNGSGSASEIGKVSVSVISVFVPNEHWERSGFGNLSSKPTKIPQIVEYLDSDAISLIHLSKNGANKGTLILEVPDEVETD